MLVYLSPLVSWLCMYACMHVEVLARQVREVYFSHMYKLTYMLRVIFLLYFSKAFNHLDLTLNDSYVSLEKFLDKMEWTSFTGVQKLLLKGLTLESTSEPTRELLSKCVCMV